VEAGEKPLSYLRAETQPFGVFRKKGGTANNFLRPFVMKKVFLLSKNTRRMKNGRKRTKHADKI
jgi:hypothetical protein